MLSRPFKTRSAYVLRVVGSTPSSSYSFLATSDFSTPEQHYSAPS